MFKFVSLLIFISANRLADLFLVTYLIY